MVQEDQENSLGLPSFSEEKTAKAVVDVLTKPQKAAVLLIAIGKETACRLIKKFNTSDLRNLNKHVHSIPDIQVDDLEKIVKDFENDFTKQGAAFGHAAERFSSLIRDNLPENEVSAVFDPQEKAEMVTENAFEILASMSADELLPYLVDEHPQIVSYILSRLPDKLAAQVLLILPVEIRMEAIRRALYIKPVLPTVEIAFNQVLHTVLTKQKNKKKVYHYKQIAKVLNQLDKKALDEIMLSLEILKEEEITAIKSGLFSFEDISRLTNRARMTLFNEVPYDVLTKALRSVDSDLGEMILSSLSQRTRRMVESEISIPNEQLLQQDILQARRQIADIALNMSERKLIDLPEDYIERNT